MASFLFQPDPIDGVHFKPIKIDIHQGVVKIVDDEIFYDFQLNTSESVIVGTDRKEVLDKFKEDLKTITPTFYDKKPNIIRKPISIDNLVSRIKESLNKISSSNKTNQKLFNDFK
jgi:hypothetical protein